MEEKLNDFNPDQHQLLLDYFKALEQGMNEEQACIYLAIKNSSEDGVMKVEISNDELQIRVGIVAGLLKRAFDVYEEIEGNVRKYAEESDISEEEIRARIISDFEELKND